MLPVKENMGRGTGMGTLMPTWPASISNWYLRAAAPLLVKMAVPLPYLESGAGSKFSTCAPAKQGAEGEACAAPERKEERKC